MKDITNLKNKIDSGEFFPFAEFSNVFYFLERNTNKVYDCYFEDEFELNYFSNLEFLVNNLVD